MCMLLYLLFHLKQYLEYMSYSLRPKLYVALERKICLKLYVALQYQCNINVDFPIITLTIYYSLFFQFFHLSFPYYLLRAIL